MLSSYSSWKTDLFLKSFGGLICIRALACISLDPTVGQNICGYLNLDRYVISLGRGASTLAGADSVNMSFPLFNMIQTYVVFLRDFIRDLWKIDRTTH